MLLVFVLHICHVLLGHDVGLEVNYGNILCGVTHITWRLRRSCHLHLHLLLLLELLLLELLLLLLSLHVAIHVLHCVHRCICMKAGSIGNHPKCLHVIRVRVGEVSWRRRRGVILHGCGGTGHLTLRRYSRVLFMSVDEVLKYVFVNNPHADH